MRSPTYCHLVARALPGQFPFVDPDLAWWMMHALRRAWPHALAACIMPNHLHLVIATDCPERERERLSKVLAAFTRHVLELMRRRDSDLDCRARGHSDLDCRARGHSIWQPVAEPTRVADRRHLQRVIRYVHLNPCRWKIVDDPLCWPWSTHRGVVGAVVDPWVTQERLARELGFRGRDFVTWYHRYVSTDPDAVREARALLRTAPPQSIPMVPLATIWDAALAATPWSPPHVRRHTFVLAARRQGWRDTQFIARVAGVSDRQVRYLSRASGPELLAAGELCLGDERLVSNPNVRRRLATSGRRKF